VQKQTHIIHKQVYELHTTAETSARKLQQEMQQVNLHSVLPAVSAVLDEYFDAEEVVQIDKLEIDLGTITSMSAPSAWSELISRQLLEKLKPFATNKLVAEQEFFRKRQHISQHLLETWIYFLQNGRLPDQSIFRSLEAVKKELLLSDYSQQQSLRLAMLELDPVVVVPRIIANTSLEELAFCFSILQPFISLEDWIKIIVRTGGNLVKNWNQFTWIQKESLFSVRQWHYIILVQFTHTLIAQAHHNMPLEKEEAESLLHEIILSTKKKLFGLENMVIPIIPLPVENITAIESNLPDIKVSMHVSNAGLCLLAPWLRNFFNITGICIGNDFKDDISRQHALFLLHFIATGETDATEEKLIFPKLLCGWPLQMPCINAFEITEAEKQEAIDLLQSVITNWPVLKNTSPAGLSESFIQRSGKLTISDDHYLLQPEQRGIDVLIDHITWGFRNTLLPWMDRRLVVEWF
jgi:hypothetical protein